MCPLCQVKFVLILKLRNTAPPALQLSFQFCVCVCVHTLFSAQHMAKSTNYDAVVFRYCFFLDKEKLGFE